MKKVRLNISSPLIISADGLCVSCWDKIFEKWKKGKRDTSDMKQADIANKKAKTKLEYDLGGGDLDIDSICPICKTKTTITIHIEFQPESPNHQLWEMI